MKEKVISLINYIVLVYCRFKRLEPQFCTALTWNICVLKLTSSDAAGDFIIIFNVARILFDEGRTSCAFYECLRTWFVGRRLLLLIFDFSCILLLIGLITAVWHWAFRILIYLTHLCLLFHFHLLIYLVLFHCLSEILIHVLMIALTIRTRAHALLLVNEATWRRMVWFARAISLIVRDVGLWFGLSFIGQRPYTLPIVAVVHFLAFTIWWLHV